MIEKGSIKQKLILIVISSVLAIIGFFLYNIVIKVEDIYERQLTAHSLVAQIELNTEDIIDHEERLRLLEAPKEKK